MAAGFRTQYEAAVEVLLGRVPPDCGTPEASLARREARLGVRLPVALRAYYESVGTCAC